MIDLTSTFGQAVKEHLKNQYVIWLTTVDSHLAPQPRPVWFIWEEESFLIFSFAQTGFEDLFATGIALVSAIVIRS